MALLYVIFASFLIALCQFCIHAKAQEQGKDEILMAIRFLISAVICAIFFPLMSGVYHLNVFSFLLGIIAGLLQGLLMLYTRKALSLGCSNLAIAILNSSCIFPPLLMAFFFGKNYHFTYSWLNSLGALSVCLGFFYAAKQLVAQKKEHLEVKEVNKSEIDFPKHLSVKILSIAFLFQVVFLVFLQWKSLNFKAELAKHPLLPFQGLDDSLWFNSIMFLTCAIFQWVQSSKSDVKISYKEFTLFGFLGGLANGFSAVLLLEGIEMANSSLENALLYPLLSIGTVFFCQIWAKWFFKESLQWKVNLFFVLGIVFSSF